MRTLDDTDREILRLLQEDARRPFSDIAEHVDLSAPAVSDRVDRLREIGVIKGFTINLDRSLLAAGQDLLVRLSVPATDVDSARSELMTDQRVEHLFESADGELTFTATVRDGAIRDLLAATVGLETVVSVDVSMLAGVAWNPALGDPDLSVDCVECGNTVTSEGETARIDETIYHFCCGSCQANFEGRYDRLQEGA